MQDRYLTLSNIDKPVNERDFLFHNEGAGSLTSSPEPVAKRGATHGVLVGGLRTTTGDSCTLPIANNNPYGDALSLDRNLLPAAQAARSV